MQNRRSLIRLLRGLIALLVEEAERNPEFATRLDKLLAPVVGKTHAKGQHRKPVAETDVPDIYQERNSRGDDGFRFWLRDQSVSMLRAMIRKHDLDGSRRTAKWKDTEKLSKYVADQLQGRMKHGSRFMHRSPDLEE